jgi:DNA repair protein RadC
MGISLKDVMQIKGLNEVKATQLAAVFEIARRIVRYLERE